MPRSNRKKKIPSNSNSQIIPGFPASSPPKTDPVTDSSPSLKLIFLRAIASAKRHALNLTCGRTNPGQGDCVFEASLFNVNDRGCFNEYLSQTVDYYRRIWTIDMENRGFDNPLLNPGYSQAEWHHGWNLMRQPGAYEVHHFGDLVIPGIACGIKKIILIFNTNPNVAHDPISVIDPNSYGIEPNSPYPLILAYDGSHYESLHPLEDIDIQKSKDLVTQYQNGTYAFGHNDLQNLIEVNEEENVKIGTSLNPLEDKHLKIKVQFSNDKDTKEWIKDKLKNNWRETGEKRKKILQGLRVAQAAVTERWP